MNTDVNITEFIIFDDNIPVYEVITDDDHIHEFKMKHIADMKMTEDVDDEDQDLPVQTRPTPSLSEVLKAATIFEDYSTNTEDCEDELALIYRLKQEVTKLQFKKELSARQCSIKDFCENLNLNNVQTILIHPLLQFSTFIVLFNTV